MLIYKNEYEIMIQEKKEFEKNLIDLITSKLLIELKTKSRILKQDSLKLFKLVIRSEKYWKQYTFNGYSFINTVHEELLKKDEAYYSKFSLSCNHSKYHDVISHGYLINQILKRLTDMGYICKMVDEYYTILVIDERGLN